MSKILIIDNYPQGYDTKNVIFLQKILKSTGIDFETRKYYEIGEIGDFDGFILTGSPKNLPEDEQEFQQEIELVKNTKKPVLGICFGHQLISLAYGARIQFMKGEPEYDSPPVTIHVSEGFDLFKSAELEAHVNHKKEVKPKIAFRREFRILGSSENCPVHVIQHRSKHVYGVQCHPERRREGVGDDGEVLIKNFVETIPSMN